MQSSRSKDLPQQVGNHLLIAPINSPSAKSSEYSAVCLIGTPPKLHTSLHTEGNKFKINCIKQLFEVVL